MASTGPLAVTSTICLLPPASAWHPIQAIRKVHDRQIGRWPPHINLLYPFLDLDALNEASFAAARENLRGALASVAPFRMELKQLKHFAHPRSATLFAAPDDAAPVRAAQALLERAFPQCRDLRERGGADGFTPHLSLGQMALHQGGRGGKGMAKKDRDLVEGTLAELASQWPESGVGFVVDRVYWLRRSRADDSVPFEIACEVRFGGAPTEPDPADRPVPDRHYDPFKASVPRNPRAEDPFTPVLYGRANRGQAQPAPAYFFDLATRRWLSHPHPSGTHPRPPASPQPASNRLVVYTQNCFSGIPDTVESASARLARFRILRSRFLSSGADVVACQEVTAELLEFLYPAGPVDPEQDSFAAAFPFSTHHAASPSVLSSAPEAGGAGTCTVFSKRPLRDARELAHGKAKHTALACVDVPLPNGGRNEVELACVHLTSDYRNDNRAKRGEQVDTILDALSPAAEDKVQLVVGDFNIAPPALAGAKPAPAAPFRRGHRSAPAPLDPGSDEPAVTIPRSRGFRDTWEAMRGPDEPGYTYDPLRNSLAHANATDKSVPRRYDRVLVRGADPVRAEVVEVEDGGEFGSDHDGLLCVFRLGAGRAADRKQTVHVGPANAVQGDWTDAQWKEHLRVGGDPREAALALLRAGRYFSQLWEDGSRDIFRLVPIGTYALSIPDAGSADLDLVCVGTVSDELFWRNLGALFGMPGVKVTREVRDAVAPLAELAVAVSAGAVKVDVQYCRIEPAQLRKLCRDPASKFTFPGKLAAPQAALVSTQMLQDRIKGKPHFRRLFVLAKRWAKARGVYATKAGFVGGFGLAVLCARILSAAEGASEGLSVVVLLRTFLATYSAWDWSAESASLGPIGRAEGGNLTVLAPAQPLNIVRNGNSFATASFAEELRRAHDLVGSRPIDSQFWETVVCADALDEMVAGNAATHFVRIRAAANAVSEFKELAGWTESRIVGLLRRLEGVVSWCRPFADPVSSRKQLPWGFHADYLLALRVQLGSEQRVREQLVDFGNRLLSDFSDFVQGSMDAEVSLVPASQIAAQGFVRGSVPGLEADVDADEGAEDLFPLELDLDEAEPSAQAPAPAAPSNKPRDPSAKLRTSMDVYNRIAWDPAYDSTRARYKIGYEDRFRGTVEAPFLSFKRDSTHDEFIPFHRVTHFRAPDGRIVWDRKLKTDLVFD
ncbi:2'-5' RNA ligase superfamily-domain-containing protein [Hyaloraphidium curvatum]|nr:2'-5' RNA ligase superfamily-domain-containing protein [Hyaloraphidium curvatum]